MSSFNSSFWESNITTDANAWLTLNIAIVQHWPCPDTIWDRKGIHSPGEVYNYIYQRFLEKLSSRGLLILEREEVLQWQSEDQMNRFNPPYTGCCVTSICPSTSIFIQLKRMCYLQVSNWKSPTLCLLFSLSWSYYILWRREPMLVHKVLVPPCTVVDLKSIFMQCFIVHYRMFFFHIVY